MPISIKINFKHAVIFIVLNICTGKTSAEGIYIAAETLNEAGYNVFWMLKIKNLTHSSTGQIQQKTRQTTLFTRGFKINIELCTRALMKKRDMLSH